MAPGKKAVISSPPKHKNKCRDQTFLKRGAQRLRFLYLWSLKGITWTKLMIALSLVHSTTLCHRAQHWTVPRGQRGCGSSSWGFSPSGARGVWFVTLCITCNSSGRHKHKPDTFAHTRGDLPKSWGEELIKPYPENNQDFNTAMCEKQWAPSMHQHQVEKLPVSGAWDNRSTGISGQ